MQQEPNMSLPAADAASAAHSNRVADHIRELIANAGNMSLPAADAASAAHSNRVADHIRELIANAGGAISFAEYMHHALYAPGLGYYSAGATKFGEAGDFVTAPEISPVFAGVVARQCAEVFASLDRPSLLEVGGGSGRLACDLLKRLRELDALPESCEILEVSADLRERQYALLESEVPDLIERVSWLDRFPESLSGVIIANEVIDALPVERFAIRAEGISQLCVTSGGDSFSIAERAAPELLIAAVEGIERDLGEPF
jgi:SAM-dependent MidA family methyltransferase